MSCEHKRVRQRYLARTEKWLRATGNPRLHMLLIVAATGGFGLVFSFVLLTLGFTGMWLRYPLAVVLSYFAFLSLLWLWMHYQEAGWIGNDRYGATDAFTDISNFAPDFGGDVAGDLAGDAAGSLDLDEWIFVLIALLALFAVLLACVYLVWTGPTLLAEVLVDGLVMSRVYRRMKLSDRSYWASGALRRTWSVAVLVALSFGVAGFAMQVISPDAVSIGPFLENLMGGK